ncbi:MAG: hypothetical protein EA397_07105 [Deltaproteobacteria bacterium]|nr:MAG: hypothetical protein EA397_07105 [Deltaproteobacteria bacterium]
MKFPALGLLTSLLASPSLALAGSPSAEEGFSIATQERIYIDSSVRLPLFMWFLSDFNREVRVTGFDIELVMTCTGESTNRRNTEVRCRIDDAALQGIPLPAERGRLGPVLEEMKDKMVGSVLVLQVRKDGKVRNVNLREAYRDGRQHRRIRLMNENLRLVLSRAIAGFDLQRPKGPLKPEMTWGQRDTLLTAAPVTVGTLGSTQIVHQSREGEGGYVLVRSDGEAMIAPAGIRGGEPRNFFEARIAVESVHEPETGRVSARAWTVVAEPTASSAIAEGFRGIPYVQNGRMVALKDHEVPELRKTEEIDPDGPQASALQVSDSQGPDTRSRRDW